MDNCFPELHEEKLISLITLFMRAASSTGDSLYLWMLIRL